jgi:DNA-binding transcriptional ArsR family regulator
MPGAAVAGGLGAVVGAVVARDPRHPQAVAGEQPGSPERLHAPVLGCGAPARDRILVREKADRHELPRLGGALEPLDLFEALKSREVATHLRRFAQVLLVDLRSVGIEPELEDHRDHKATVRYDASVCTEASRFYTAGLMALGQLTRIGALLADQTRSQFLTVLMDGRARTGGELARQAAVAPSTASEHLSRLLDAGLITVEAQGRHRYFRLAGAEIAQMLESLGAVHLPEPRTTGSSPKAAPELTYARSCYDHLAGELAVHIYDQLLAHGHLHLADHRLTITPSGEALLASLGVDINSVRTAKRPAARGCLDWTERRHHLAGAAGAALFQALLTRRWIAHGSRPRSIRITATGQQAIHKAFTA